MSFWIVFILFILLLVSLYSLTQKKIFKKIFLSATCIVLVIVIGFRKHTIGLGDVQNIYIPIYYKYILNKSFSFVFLTLKDPTFYLCVKIISMCFNSFQMVLVVYALFLVITIINFIKKESKSMIISLVMFIALNYFGTAFSGLRHMIALVIILISYKYYQNRDAKKFIICVLIASLFHITALSFLIGYWINISRKGKKWVFYYCGILIATYMMMKFGNTARINYILKTIITTFRLERFEEYSKISYSSLNDFLFFQNLMIFGASSCIYYNIDYNKIGNGELKKKLEGLINLQFIGTWFCCFVFILGEFNRIAMFYTIFSIILVPECFACIKKSKELLLTEFIFVFLLVFYFIFFGIYNYNLIPYEFFWR